MATRFAIGNGNWSNTATWDGGALPLSNDDIFANNFTVTIDQDITVGSLRNTLSDVYLPGMPIPKMTGNTQPNGVAFAGQNTSTAFQAFDYNTNTSWASAGINLTNCFIGYNFPTGKIIKRYYFFRTSAVQRPQSWTFEGSNDGVNYTILETVVSNSATTPYLSGILPNTTSYTYYRLNVTAVNAGTTAWVYSLEMTESTGTVFGTATGGKYVVPNTLSGSRNIVQTGDGIIFNNLSTIVETNNTAGNTVNFNVSGSGLILNRNFQTANVNTPVINILGNGTVNFNSNIYGTETLNVQNGAGAICINANATVTVNGNVYLGRGGAGLSGCNTINLLATTSNSAILNINGNIIGSNIMSYNGVYLNSAATINVTGNLISDVSPCIITPVSNAFTGGAGNINLVGTATMTNASSQPCILTRTTLVTITGSVTNKGDTSAIWSNKIRWTNVGVPYWIFQDTTGADIALSNGTISGSYPTEADVRLGVTYASGPVRTGTCAVPLPQYVSQGVPVGSSVGTGYLNPAEVWNILTSTIATTNSIGVRLKVASTIETTGDQLAAF